MIISGKELSAKLKAEMAAEVAAIGEKYGRVPHLVVILVGEDPGSVSYVTGKAKASAEVGIRNTTIRKPETISEAELLGIIAELNADAEVDGILVQLPLPKHIDEDKVIEAIDKAKDVDGFHPLNVAALWQKQPCTLPCTPKGIIKMLKAAGVGIAGKEAVVIGRSNIVGLPVSKLLLDENATVTMTHSRTRNLPEVTRRADILVVAIGRPKFVTADMVREGAVVIDVGVNRDPETGKLVRRRRFRRSRAEGFGHHPRAGRCGADDDLLPDGEYDRVFSAADGPEIDDECLNRVFPVWDKHSDKIGSVAGPKCPEAKASGHLFSCGTNCVLPLPLSPCRCAGIGVVCCVPCAVCGGGRLSLGFACCLYPFCWCWYTFASTGCPL